VRFLLGWLRTVVKGQRCRAVLTFNPPTSAEGRWIVAFFAPWLDPKHPNPAKPGELRWFGTVAGRTTRWPTTGPSSWATTASPPTSSTWPQGAAARPR
jgi:hypothetical protein